MIKQQLTKMLNIATLRERSSFTKICVFINLAKKLNSYNIDHNHDYLYESSTLQVICAAVAVLFIIIKK